MESENRVLIHTCCAPCTCYPMDVLKKEKNEIALFWCNPNIHGYREYNKRLMTLGYYMNKFRWGKIIEMEYEPERWFNELNRFEKNARCEECYRLRLENTAVYAKRKGFNSFTTTLLYSKYQNHEKIKSVGEEISKNRGINFLYRDFRRGWKEGILLSKKLGLYRQEYCGCIFSERERYDVSKKS